MKNKNVKVIRKVGEINWWNINIKLATSYFERTLGLMGKSGPLTFGLWIMPGPSIHTCFMRVNIDVIFLDKDYKILKIIRSMKPWRMTLYYYNAKSVLELPGGFLNSELKVGDKLEFADV